MAFFSIPGNIKQSFLPFVLNPDAAINKFGKDSVSFNASAKSASPQLFTYKNDEESPGGTAILGFYPATSCPDVAYVTNKSGLDKDLSFKLLYGHDEKSKRSLTIDDIISTIPGVSIREFLPDTRLDQCLNFFKDLAGVMSDMITTAKDVGKNEKDESGKLRALMDKIWDCAWYTMQYMAGTTDSGDSFFKDVFSNNAAEAFRSSDIPIYTSVRNSDIGRYVHDFPFILYYRLQSCTTTNIYKVPAMCDGKSIASSDGMPGWGDGSDIMGAGGFRVSGLLKKIPAFGEIADMMLGNIGINYMPWWNAESGAKVKAPEITVKFDLFNDNVIKAVKNFVFINTVVPNNKWIQYNMFQHSSNLYDIKIDGVNRLFACSAKFDVTYDGVLRNPSEKFFEELSKCINTNCYSKDQFMKFMKSNNLIKIPDVYHVNMTFQSLFPANFNNFLYIYSMNVNHMTEYKQNVRDDSFGRYLGNGISKFAKRIKNVWNDGDGSDRSIDLQEALEKAKKNNTDYSKMPEDGFGEC